MNPYEPTNALPGTQEKIAVLQARAALGLDLFHPQDATIPLGDDPSIPEVEPPHLTGSQGEFLEKSYRLYLERLNASIRPVTEQPRVA